MVLLYVCLFMPEMFMPNMERGTERVFASLTVICCSFPPVPTTTTKPIFGFHVSKNEICFLGFCETLGGES